LAGPWDAPPSLRERYRDEEDPPIPTFTTLPSRTLPDDVDLDERFALSMAYAAQVSLLDVCLGGLFEHLEETGLDRRTAVVVCGVRGLALAEHHRVGFDDRRLYAENVHVPWVMRLPEGRGRLRRSQALVQPGDLLPTVAELLNVSTTGSGRSLLPLVDGTATTIRDRTPIVGSGEFALRTPRWSLRVVEPTEQYEARAELFVKPDDVWEVNDVADRCPDAVNELRHCYADTVAALTAGREPPPLPPTENLLAET
jgi:arylsulfatase A-like enzyme